MAGENTRNKRNSHKNLPAILDQNNNNPKRSSTAERFRAAYAARSYRMFAPFLTQLTKQYDPIEIQNAERHERRKQAQNSYKSSFPSVRPDNLKDIKI